jgi:hypothetical protein
MSLPGMRYRVVTASDAWWTCPRFKRFIAGSDPVYHGSAVARRKEMYYMIFQTIKNPY